MLQQTQFVVKVYESTCDIIADAIGWRYDNHTGTWYNRTNEAASELDAGYCAFYADIKYADLPTAGLKSGWLEASGYGDYQSEMMREESSAAQYAWMI